MPASLRVIAGNGTGDVYPICGSPVRLGRHPDCEITIDASAVSRFHAHLVADQDGYAVEDLKSRNGTFVNDDRIGTRVRLRSGDRVTICDWQCEYHGGEDQPLAPAPDAELEGGPSEMSSTIITTLDAQSSADLMVKVNAEGKLRALLELIEATGLTLERQKLFPRMLQSLMKIFPAADRAMVVIVRPGGGLEPVAAHFRKPSPEDDTTFSRTIVKQAMETRHAILSADLGNDERFSLNQSVMDMQVRSIMCVPLLAPDTGEALGVIQIDTASFNQQFAEDDLHLLASVGGQASVCLVNARLHEAAMSQAKLERELGFAKEVQIAFLPKKLPKLPGYEFHAFYEAAGEVGGDFYEFFPLPGRRHAIVLGDVSGKGVPAALLMAKAVSDTKVALLTCPDDIDEAAGRLNNSIAEAGLDDKFITTAVCVLTPADHTLQIVNAGHMSPIVVRAAGGLDEPAEVEVTGLPIGVMDDYPYEHVVTTLQPGDAVVIFSDGINEAMNSDGHEYKMERIREVLAGCTGLPAAEIADALLKDVRRHVADFRQSDDMTLVVFCRRAE